MIEKGIVALLLGNNPFADVNRAQAQAKVMNTIGRAIFPQAAPQGQSLPYLIIRRSGGEHVKAMAGRAGIARPMIAVDCYATDEQTAKSVIDQVGRCLDGYRGIAGAPAPPPAGFQIQGMFAADNPDGYEPPIRGEEQGAHAAGMEFMVWVNE